MILTHRVWRAPMNQQAQEPNVAVEAELRGVSGFNLDFAQLWPLPSRSS